MRSLQLWKWSRSYKMTTDRDRCLSGPQLLCGPRLAFTYLVSTLFCCEMSKISIVAVTASTLFCIAIANSAITP